MSLVQEVIMTDLLCLCSALLNLPIFANMSPIWKPHTPENLVFFTSNADLSSPTLGAGSRCTQSKRLVLMKKKKKVGDENLYFLEQTGRGATHL